MIDDKDVDKAVHWLLDSAETIATAKANLVYMEGYMKSLKAQIMKEHADMSVSAQEREAYSDDRMKEQLKAIKTATFNYEKLRFKREAQMAKIETWRTYHANLRSIKI
tara:strand:- start:3771 stop:4094 length:324 start_codon:yes stop_codon:yes gene_type:complete